MKAETMLRNLGEATREAVHAIADGTGGGRNEHLVLYRAFAIALVYDAFRCELEEKVALTKLLQSFVEGEAGEKKFCVACDAAPGLFSQSRPRSAKFTRRRPMRELGVCIHRSPASRAYTREISPVYAFASTRQRGGVHTPLAGAACIHLSAETDIDGAYTSSSAVHTFRDRNRAYTGGRHAL